ncbi:hypothetical protein LPY66_07885 [Dehalobacter sp. DCM]|uniref:hypothetical protein n=1 Tax=Dehalobacter sp. DCM TaxID=2907827 RepID=UPI003081A65E|nr:hypothetical protein LPY66_07885 [Dehalobacter sp. DCM]
MEKQPKISSRSRKTPRSSIFMYVMSIVIALVGIAYIINSIYYFKTTIANYVAQGYPYELVASEVIPGQLLPGLLQPLGIIGIAVVIYGAALINHKLSRYLNSIVPCETVEDVASPATAIEEIAQKANDQDVTAVVSNPAEDSKEENK